MHLFSSLLALAGLTGLAAAQASIEQVVVLGRLCPDAGSYATSFNANNTAVTMGFNGIMTGDGSETCTIIVDMTYPPGCNRVTFEHVTHGFTDAEEGSVATVTIDFDVSAGLAQTVTDSTFRLSQAFSRRYVMDGTVRIPGDTNDAVRMTVDLTALVEPSGVMFFDDYTFALLDMQVVDEEYCI